MKLLKIAICVFLCLLFVQCDSPERRKKKAEEIIEKHLFETLNNYKSYEKISTEVDTLQDLFLISNEIRELGDSLVWANMEYGDKDSYMESLQHEVEKSKNSALNTLLSGGSNTLLVLLTQSSEVEKCNKEIAQLRKTLKKLSDDIDYFETRIANCNDSISKPKKPYWFATHKFRYSDNGNDTFIHTMNFIFDPKIKKIIYSWDDDDIDKTCTINYIKKAINSKISSDRSIEPTDSI